MLINYFIEPDAIPVADGIDRAVRRQLLDAIREYGIRAGSRCAWKELLDRIPQGERKLWEVVLERIPQNEFEVDLLSPSAVDVVLEHARDSVVALSEQSFVQWANAHRFPSNSEEELFRIAIPPQPNTAEVLTVPYFSSSETYDDRRHWNETGVQIGEHRDEIWNDRILPILEHCTTVHIFDRYFLRQISQIARTRHRSRDSGPFWLAEKIRTDLQSSPIAVKLYTWEVEGAVDTYNQQMLQEFRDSAAEGISELKCYIPAGGAHEVIPHDRHWRGASSKWSAKIEFGSSIEMFANSQFTQNFQLKAFVLSSSTRSDLINVEHQIQRKCRPPLGNW